MVGFRVRAQAGDFESLYKVSKGPGPGLYKGLR